jgi:polyisoprenoid-binding protein YceI
MNSAVETPPGSTFALDPIHSTTSFSLTAMGVSVFRAAFAKIGGELRIADDQATLRVSVTIDSISVREPAEFRAHILGSDFFAADLHPEASFESDPFEVTDGEISITGRLTIRGTTHAVQGRGRWSGVLTEPSGKQRRHLTLSGAVDRHEFGMTWNMQLPSGESHLGDIVNVEAELGFVTSA